MSDALFSIVNGQKVDKWIWDELLGADDFVDSYSRDLRTAGGPGSGNFGHSGRPGEVGGSSDEGGGDLEPTRQIDGHEFVDFALVEQDIEDLDQAAAIGERAREFMDERLLGRDWVESLTSGQRSAVGEYLAEGGYDQINWLLRTGTLHEKMTDLSEAVINKHVQNLDQAIAANTLQTGVVTYRGLDDENGVFAKLKPGDSFVDKGFVSTSLNEYVADNYSGTDKGLIMEIRVPKGTHAAPLESVKPKDFEQFAYNQELLLARGTSFRVVSRTKSRMVVEAQAVR